MSNIWSEVTLEMVDCVGIGGRVGGPGGRSSYLLVWGDKNGAAPTFCTELSLGRPSKNNGTKYTESGGWSHKR